MRQAAQRNDARRPVPARILLAGHEVLLLPAGAAYLPDERLLVVADLHLGKGLAYASGGQMLPPYDSLDTMRRLLVLVHHWQPERLVLLGDSIHRQRLMEASLAPVAAELEELARSVKLVWITGNHDPALSGLPGEVAGEIELPGALRLRHEPAEDGHPEIVGHLHPAARLPTRAGRQRRRCFVVAEPRLLLPAFGALTGALCVSDPAIAGLFPASRSRVYLMLGEGLAELPMTAVS
ncbi:ligase-associated DNA damage response endonuclease PdeM [Rhabdaerophilum sp. SD176]|uniref:ligase-associated DNA damage response endonuclease PdeM n=1 Tax=Rhabdaerophilum sp. SD176 TaxID=2983548 RepID=UPI0024DFB943|nr:ligase-associated DNA damage response endonuclease PdeM [Rhabdaerophilum sp. SD176]